MMGEVLSTFIHIDQSVIGGCECVSGPGPAQARPFTKKQSALNKIIFQTFSNLFPNFPFGTISGRSFQVFVALMNAFILRFFSAFVLLKVNRIEIFLYQIEIF